MTKRFIIMTDLMRKMMSMTTLPSDTEHPVKSTLHITPVPVQIIGSLRRPGRGRRHRRRKKRQRMLQSDPSCSPANRQRHSPDTTTVRKKSSGFSVADIAKTNAIRDACMPCSFSRCANNPVDASKLTTPTVPGGIPSLGERFVANVLDSIPDCTYLYDCGLSGLRGIKQGQLRFDFIVTVKRIPPVPVTSVTIVNDTTAALSCDSDDCHTRPKPDDHAPTATDNILHLHDKAHNATGVIEYQGFYHYHVLPGKNSDSQLQRQCTNDWLKRIFCTAHNLPYLELPYWLPPNEHEHLVRNFIEHLRYSTPSEASCSSLPGINDADASIIINSGTTTLPQPAEDHCPTSSACQIP